MELEVDLRFYNDANETLSEDELRARMEDFLTEMREVAKRHNLGWCGTTSYDYTRDRLRNG